MFMRTTVLAIGVAAVLCAGSDVSVAQEENVTVGSNYLTDTDGYDYGADYWLSSTVSSQVCVYPRVVKQANVNGAVTPGPVLMQAYETGVSIGQFIAADQSQPWEVEVAAQWQRC